MNDSLKKQSCFSISNNNETYDVHVGASSLLSVIFSVSYTSKNVFTVFEICSSYLLLFSVNIIVCK